VFVLSLSCYLSNDTDRFVRFGCVISGNLLDLTAGVIPVTKTSSADKIAADFKPANDIEVGIYRNYDPEIYKGAPVGIQIVAKKLEEEKALAMMTVVDEALKKSRK